MFSETLYNLFFFLQGTFLQQKHIRQAFTGRRMFTGRKPLETILNVKNYTKKRNLEGLYLHNPELRQRALLLKRKLTELINEPDEDHNILLLSRLGPYPNY